MPAPTLDLTEANIITALGNYLVTIFPTIPIIRGQGNRVPEPAGSDFIVMTPSTRIRLATNVVTWVPVAPVATVSMTAMQVAVQCDLHGPASADNAQILVTLFRGDSACVSLAGSGFNLQPLYAVDPVQVPFFNAEDQYEERWTVDVVLQANPNVTVAQDFADALYVNLELAD